jgi:hypothetical protein
MQRFCTQITASRAASGAGSRARAYSWFPRFS